MTVVAVLLLDRISRRPLLLGGLGGMLATLLVLGGAFYLPELGGALGYVATGSLMLYVAFFAIDLGPVFWLLISEIYPLNVRGTAMGVATVVNWLANLVVAQLFPQRFDTIGPALTFWLFAGLTAGIVFTHYLVPETEGRSLEETGPTCARRQSAASRYRWPSRSSTPTTETGVGGAIIRAVSLPIVSVLPRASPPR